MRRVRLFLILFLLPAADLLPAQRPVVDNPAAESMTLDQASAHLMVFEVGQSRQPIRYLERQVYLATAAPDRRADMAHRLLTVLQSSEASLPGRRLACQWICLVDDAAAVPALSAMLDEPETFDMALGALEHYESGQAEQVLLGALRNYEGKQQIAIINALGRRGGKQAVQPLASLLSGDNTEITPAAAISLGMIGSDAAAQELLHAENVSEAIRRDALLRCAAKLRHAGNLQLAEQIYRVHWKQRSLAGLIGLAALQGQQCREELLEALDSDDPLLVKTAIHLAGAFSDASMDQALMGWLSSAAPDSKIALIRMFAEERKSIALKAITDELASPDDEVFRAAIQAVGQLGDPSSVEPLARLASTQSGPRQKMAQESLTSLGGPGVDGAIRQMIQQGGPALRAELIKAAVKRKISLEDEQLWGIVKRQEEPKAAREEAINALVETPKPDTYRQLIAFWSQPDDLSLSRTIKSGIMHLGLQLPEEIRSEPLLQALQSQPAPPVMGSMLAVGGHFDHPGFRDILHRSLESPSAQVQLEAVKALASWPANKGNNELIKVATASSNATQRILAGRALLGRGESGLLPLADRIALLEVLASSDADEDVKRQAQVLQKKLLQELSQQ